MEPAQCRLYRHSAGSTGCAAVQTVCVNRRCRSAVVVVIVVAVVTSRVGATALTCSAAGARAVATSIRQRSCLSP